VWPGAARGRPYAASLTLARRLDRRVWGHSTESGIPDYRSPNGAYTKGHKPTTFSDFMRSAKVRQRYWARSMEGWPLFSSIRPNTAHTSLAALEAAGAVDHVITQVGPRANATSMRWRTECSPARIDSGRVLPALGRTSTGCTTPPAAGTWWSCTGTSTT